MSWGKLIKSAASVYNAYDSYKSGQRAEDIADQNASLIQQQADEEARRFSRQAEQNMGRLRAGAAASGTKLEGTILDYLSDVEGEQNKQLSWIKSSGASRAKVQRQQGDNYASQGKAGAYGNLFQAANDWMDG